MATSTMKWYVRKTSFVPKSQYTGDGRYVYQCRRGTTRGAVYVTADYLVCADTNEQAKAIAEAKYEKDDRL